MKVGDLVRHKRLGKLALIIKPDASGGVWSTPESGKVHRFPEFVWLDNGEIDSCYRGHLEVISESR